MSFKVLIVPEDPTYNGALLSPLVSRMLAECGRPNAKVSVLANPKVSGYEYAIQSMPAIIARYSHLDLLLFLVDADGRDRSQTFQTLEAAAAAAGTRLFCCAARQEVEVWLLAGHVDKLDRPWNEVREDVSVKENVFARFLERYGDRRRAGGGRDLLMQATLTNYAGLLQRCPELKELEDKVRAAVRPRSDDR